ncbi:glycosyltransferase [Planococcus sp. SSTMD024]|uniref:glycosyltransferase n=1 Tax=Planococcus sp. SSTMD024 TaxID=3242163 RepID=UPI00351E6CE5
MQENIGYLIVREELFSPLVKTQVFDVLSAINKEKFKVYLIWACRVDYYFKKKKEFEKIKNRLKNNGIELIRIPIIVYKFPLSKFELNLLSLQTITTLEKIVKHKKINILHARGYNSGFLLAKVNKRKKVEVKTIFDARSPYLTELQSTYKIDKESKKFKDWSDIERFIANNNSLNIAISERFEKYLNQYDGNVLHIPNNAQVPPSSEIYSLAKKKRRNSICYVGSIGNGWNNVKLYSSVVKEIHNKYPQINFEFYVLPSGIELVKKEFKKSGIPDEIYSVETKSPEDIKSSIIGCLAGLQVMNNPDVRMGIKTVEYLSAGIPIICNSNAIGCSDIVEKYGVGVNIDRKNAALDDFIKKVIEDNDDISKRCVTLAEKKFSTSSVAKLYESSYERLLVNN